MLTEYSRQVPAGLGGDATVCFGQEIISLTEDRGLFGTRFGAGRLESLRDSAFIAHRAFADIWHGRVPFVPWNAKGARHHAIPATDALVSVVDHWAFIRLMKCTDGTG